MPPSLATVTPIPLAQQTLDQLRAERDYWAGQVRSAPEAVSATAAETFWLACIRWIARRNQGATETRRDD